MRNLDSPVWQRVAKPQGSKEELTALRKTFAAQPHYAELFAEFIYAEYLTAHYQARLELNPELKQAYLGYADALADLTDKLFAPSQTTERQPVCL